MSGTLYVVATPIGNLEDITLRALRVLRTVSVIAAEDTRRTAKLLAHYTIATPTVSFHEHNSRARAPQLLERLRRGESIAVVSDAGTPGVSDPGMDLVAAAASHGFPVEAIPGPSAVLTALAVSGFPAEPTTFLGFPPHRGNDRKVWLARIPHIGGTVVFFESPHRILATLNEMRQIDTVNRPIMVGRELTKVHEEIFRGTIDLVYDQIRAPRGEYTVVLGPVQDQEKSQVAVTPDQAIHDFGYLTENGGLDRRTAIRELAKRYGQSSRAVFALLEQAKISGE